MYGFCDKSAIFFLLKPNSFIPEFSLNDKWDYIYMCEYPLNWEPIHFMFLTQSWELNFVSETLGINGEPCVYLFLLQISIHYKVLLKNY